MALVAVRYGHSNRYPSPFIYQYRSIPPIFRTPSVCAAIPSTQPPTRVTSQMRLSPAPKALNPARLTPGVLVDKSEHHQNHRRIRDWRKRSKTRGDIRAVGFVEQVYNARLRYSHDCQCSHLYRNDHSPIYPLANSLPPTRSRGNGITSKGRPRGLTSEGATVWRSFGLRIGRVKPAESGRYRRHQDSSLFCTYIHETF